MILMRNNNRWNNLIQCCLVLVRSLVCSLVVLAGALGTCTLTLLPLLLLFFDRLLPFFLYLVFFLFVAMLFVLMSEIVWDVVIGTDGGVSGGRLDQISTTYKWNYYPLNIEDGLDTKPRRTCRFCHNFEECCLPHIIKGSHWTSRLTEGKNRGPGTEQ